MSTAIAPGNPLMKRLPWLSSRVATDLAGPILVVLILAMLILPLPPLLLDLFFTFNIAIAMLVLLASMHVEKPLEFSIFPTALLLTTLLRLSLNVASTRVVLMQGHTGPDAAGKVIEAFGHFLVGGNFAVGIVVFAILVVINFVVITKGAGRIAEVSARFALDAMPGKQMAIDADLNAGLIGEDVARKRRAEIADEADFFGSMDGASKYVRGDAIAGILILFINMLGGIVVGMMQHDLSFSEAGKTYTLLAIGDGLVAQIPSLIISMAAGMIVSRVGRGENLGHQVVAQMFRNQNALFVTAGVLALIGIIPGMPHFSFLCLAAAAAGIAFARKSAVAKKASLDATVVPVAPQTSLEATWDDVSTVDVLGLEVGYRLVPLVDASQDGELLKRIKSLRRKFAQEVGFLPPAVHIRDNLELRPSGYRITLKGVIAAEGEAYSGMLMAINPGHVAAALPGTATKDPTFGLPAIWIEAAHRDHAISKGYTVVDAGTVVATHLNHVVQTHAAELLGRQETQHLIDVLAKSSPKLVEELTPKLLSLGTVQKVLQNLLSEQVPIRDLRTIAEALADHGARTQDHTTLTSTVRVALGRAIVQQVYGNASQLAMIGLDPELEHVLLQAANLSDGDTPGIEPNLAQTLIDETARAVRVQETQGLPPALLVADRLRAPLSRFLRRAIPQLKVIAVGEIPDHRTVRLNTIVGARA
ncbi:MAG: flagellar biosynthesis protein FlhA [Burkholderiaceae bacterium]